MKVFRHKSFMVGITGAFGSGKSAAADFFESKGFVKITLSSFLEQEAKRRKIKKITRKILQDIGNEWRKKYGKEVLVRKALNFLKEENINKIVIDGIRNIGEIEQLRKQNNLLLLAIVADRKIRFERLKKLKRRENLTELLFNRLDSRDLGLGQKETGLQVAQCIAVADVFIENNNGIDKFKEKLEDFLKDEENNINSN